MEEYRVEVIRQVRSYARTPPEIALALEDRLSNTLLQTPESVDASLWLDGGGLDTAAVMEREADIANAFMDLPNWDQLLALCMFSSILVFWSSGGFANLYQSLNDFVGF